MFGHNLFVALEPPGQLKGHDRSHTVPEESERSVSHGQQCWRKLLQKIWNTSKRWLQETVRSSWELYAAHFHFSGEREMPRSKSGCATSRIWKTKELEGSIGVRRVDYIP